MIHLQATLHEKSQKCTLKQYSTKRNNYIAIPNQRPIRSCIGLHGGQIYVSTAAGKVITLCLFVAAALSVFLQWRNSYATRPDLHKTQSHLGSSYHYPSVSSPQGTINVKPP
eukprot:TRINITY_DN12639_c0_g2_i12.p1 TRINITY_DN12639_c0_g2~~TRINITY_DN12639_c0_g2_i12.p1  ORF type:complete len:112 (-),score=9.52 TRINITY_DN12639_c0_g2_i12:1327-1662(-)